MKLLNLIHFTIILTLIGCAQPPVDNRNKYVVFKELLDTEKFAEARALKKQYPSTVPVSLDVADYERCVPILKICSALDKTSPTQIIRKCIFDHATNCDVQGRHHLVGKWSSVESDVQNLFFDLRQSKSVPLNLAAACEPKKWGYWQIRRLDCPTCFDSLNRDPDRLQGQYDSKSDCEEHRSKDPKYETAGCSFRYVGNEIIKEIFEIEVMAVSDGPTNRFKIKFENLEKCSAATTNGFEYYEDDAQNINYYKIHPLGSKENIRFVGQCKKSSFTACAKNCVDCKSEAEVL